MKFIVLKNFRNVPSVGLKLEDANHNDQIDKGEIVEIGAGKTLKECNNHDKSIIAQLVYAGCIGDAADKAVVEAVAAEVKVDAAREEAAKKAAEANNDSALVKEILAKMRATPAAPEAPKK